MVTVVYSGCTFNPIYIHVQNCSISSTYQLYECCGSKMLDGTFPVAALWVQGVQHGPQRHNHVGGHDVALSLIYGYNYYIRAICVVFTMDHNEEYMKYMVRI